MISIPKVLSVSGVPPKERKNIRWEREREASKVCKYVRKGRGKRRRPGVSVCRERKNDGEER
jgi:hypothetical protein